MTTTIKIKGQIPEVYGYLFEPHRYKISYGGRGAGRTWSYARALLAKAMLSQIRILCCREIMNSIRDSIHQTLRDQIHLLGLDEFFDIQERAITCKTTGSEFIFRGLYRNVNAIKSIAGINICDIEEAESVSEESWSVLIPSIREPNSEIWARWNTKYSDDPTYERFVKNPPHDAVVKKTGWEDNPWFPDVLRLEKESDYAYRPQEAKNIWGGMPIGVGRKVWPLFSFNTHVKNFDMEKLKLDKNVSYFMAMDPAQHYYPAILWAAVMCQPSGGRTIWIYNEWPTRQDVGDEFHAIRKKLLYSGSLMDLSKSILVNDGTLQWGIKIRKRAMDTRFAKGAGAGSYFSGDTQGLVSEFAKKDNGGLIFHCPYEKIIDAQAKNIQQDLQYNTTLPIGPFNEPALYISPSCHNLILSMQNHRLKEDSEVEDEKYKDFSDCLRILYASIEGENLKPQPANYVSHGVVPVYANQRQVTNAWMGS
jgi:phage terminase large subunit